VSLYTDKYWLEQASKRLLPLEGMISVALYFHENRKFRPLVKLVEPLFAEESRKINDQFAMLIDPLCDAYDALYKTDRKKSALLSRLADHSSRAIRSDANLRLATWLHDSGDIAGAWRAFQGAIRADPDNPSAAILEITLLCANGERDLAGQRAEFWLRRLGSGPDINPEALSILESAREDPCGWYEEYSASMISPELSALTDWISDNQDRPLPAYRWQPVPAEADDTFMRGAHELVAPQDIRQIEGQWMQICPLDKPFSTSWLPEDTESAWEAPETWLSFLRETPDVLDSFDIIDDVLTLLITAEALEYELTDKHALQPLLARGIRMLEISRPPVEATATLPWIIPENRPALRTLARAISLSDQAASASGRKRLINWYLDINPNDNHGFRTLAVDDLLAEGNDQAALDLIDRYPDDHGHAELLYGGVLALYRQNRKGEALTRLMKAGEKLPLVLEYLLKEKVPKPSLREGRITIGGKDQAWIYREMMRDTWLSTEGMTEWLKGARKHIRRK
jgi:tetratricopeptide (TPR) repeat protein